MKGVTMLLRNECWHAVALGLLAVLIAWTPIDSAHGEMVLNKVIIDLQPGRPAYDDIEVWNDGAERMYVLAEAAEITAPGRPDQQRITTQDPSVSGLLVAPQRLVLEPGQRRVIRVSAVAPRRDTDRVYRLTIKPVGGPVSADESALKVYVGYDALVLYRPQGISGGVSARREGHQLILDNNSNTAQELFDGKQCNAAGVDCRALASTRLYAGATLNQRIPFDTPVEYSIRSGGKTMRVKY